MIKVQREQKYTLFSQQYIFTQDIRCITRPWLEILLSLSLFLFLRFLLSQLSLSFSHSLMSLVYLWTSDPCDSFVRPTHTHSSVHRLIWLLYYYYYSYYYTSYKLTRTNLYKLFHRSIIAMAQQVNEKRIASCLFSRTAIYLSLTCWICELPLFHYSLHTLTHSLSASFTFIQIDRYMWMQSHSTSYSSHFHFILPHIDHLALHQSSESHATSFSPMALLHSPSINSTSSTLARRQSDEWQNREAGWEKRNVTREKKRREIK